MHTVVVGFVLDDVSAAPPAAVARLADQLRVDVNVLEGYGEREQTRTDHLRLVLRYLGWRLPQELEIKELEEFLLARAMEHTLDLSTLPAERRRFLAAVVRRSSMAKPARRRMMYSYIMLRTQISLTEDERRTLDAAAARTGRSISALIREAVGTVYGTQRSAAEDLTDMRQAFGSWTGRDQDSVEWVDQIRSGTRLRHER